MGYLGWVNVAGAALGPLGQPGFHPGLYWIYWSPDLVSCVVASKGCWVSLGMDLALTFQLLEI